jgi:MoxR-like ATPase
MAQAATLRPGMVVTITAGPHEGYMAKVVDPTVIPDGQENQRKILVRVEENELGQIIEPAFEEYILPRLIDQGRGIRNRQLADQQFAIAALTNAQFDATTTPSAPLVPMIKAEPITDPMDPALDRFRPSTHVVKQYINRTIINGMLDVDFLLTLRDQRDSRGFSPNVALVGETQSGKTMLVQVLAVLAAERDGMPKPYPIFTLSGSSGITSYDLFGQTTAVEMGGREALVWMEGLVPMACRCGGFLYLDEWNAVPPAQAVAVHPVLDDRRQFVNTQRAVSDSHGGWAPEVVNADPGLWVISTINPGYKGTQTMAEATSNRFRWIPWDYDKDTEQALVPSTTVRIIGDTLRQLRQDRVVTVPVGTSALQRFNSDCATFGVDVALWIFQGLFPPNERIRVETVIQDNGFLDLLRVEYPGDGNIGKDSVGVFDADLTL